MGLATAIGGEVPSSSPMAGSMRDIAVVVGAAVWWRAEDGRDDGVPMMQQAAWRWSRWCMPDGLVSAGVAGFSGGGRPDFDRRAMRATAAQAGNCCLDNG